MTSPIIVFDTAIQPFLDNRIFDPTHAAHFPGASWLPRLKDRCIQHGWQIMTADVFLNSRVRLSPAYCISDMVTPYTRDVIERRAVPAVILSGESPNGAWDFYDRLTRYTAPYEHAILFRGVKNLVKSSTKFHSMYWPNTRREVLSGLPWTKRQFLVMVSSNKQRFRVSANKPLRRVRRLALQIVWRHLQFRNPLFRFEDLYQKRLDEILYFADTPGFRLFGLGWDQPDGLLGKYYHAAKRAGARPVPDKVVAMSDFRFSLCYENCVFPGYVTEKVFDCFFAGCIPIYLGAPDITDFIPSDTFIDARLFKSGSELNNFLQNIVIADAQGYLDAAQRFMNSSDFDKFYQDNFVDGIISWLMRIV